MNNLAMQKGWRPGQIVKLLHRYIGRLLVTFAAFNLRLTFLDPSIALTFQRFNGLTREVALRRSSISVKFWAEAHK
jgi:hypothetical protein